MKLRFVTDAVASVEVDDLVVAEQGDRFVAIFNQRLLRGEQVESMRKVLTFEQREGQWKITRDHELPTGHSGKVASAGIMLANNTPAVREAE
jgi:ketosteroid isomerase-like protein